MLDFFRLPPSLQFDFLESLIMSTAKEQEAKDNTPPSPQLDEKVSQENEQHHVIPTSVAEREGAKVMEVENADFAVALTSGPQLNPLSWASIQLYFILLVAFMGSMSNGFDGQVG